MFSKSPKEKLKFILKGIECPETSRISLETFYDQLCYSKSRKAEFEQIIEMYDDENFDYKKLLDRFNEFAKEGKDVNTYEANGVLICILFYHLREIYLKEGISEDIFWDGAKDLKYKIKECELVKQCTGIFVPTWYGGFLNMTIFGFGRLEFQKCTAEFECDGIKINDQAIAVHIPRTETHIDKKSVDEALKKAYEFFKKDFESEKVLFTIHSWLLFNENRNILPESSNIVQFMNRFNLVKTIYNEDYTELWRIFDADFVDAKSLKGDSTLRRGYIKLVEDNKPIGAGVGYFYKTSL